MTLHSSTLSIDINCHPDQIYNFVSNPLNLPLWATAFCKSVRQDTGSWVMETPHGPVPIRFAEANRLGVLDHFVNPVPGVEVYVPMRVVANGSGSAVIFTLFRAPDVTDENFAEDVATVRQDLNTLKAVLEGGNLPNA